ncbi:MAG: LPS export ABC transporter periplasmic protein LptC [Armatimonadetes bacterium]|nr:LPS export ABC transporter periplasmic protein LptC [Armatimonadota bacterium]
MNYLCLSLGLAAMLAVGCARQNEPVPAQIVREAARREVEAARDNLSGLKGAAMVMKGGELQGGDAQGRPLWSLGASEIRASGQMRGGLPARATLSNARATLYREGKPESSLRAPQITFFNSANGVRLQLQGGISLQSAGPWTGARGAVKVRAVRGDVDVKTRVISASGGVAMSQGGVEVTGQTLRAQTSLQKAEIAGKVRAKSPNGQIEAVSATYDWKKGRLAAQTVTARREDTQITGKMLEADTAATRGVLRGNVVAKSARGSARAPRIDFDWGKDFISAANAIFEGQGATVRAAKVQTDKQMRIASASDLTLQKDGATLRAAFANGFDGLERLRGREVRFSRGDLTFSAPSAEARKSGAGWILTATNGARGQNASGRVSAARVMWDESSKRVEASGGVTMQKDGATLSGATLSTDTKFQNARLSGNVRGKMKDGSTLSSGKLEKRGERYFASDGATARLKSSGAVGDVTLRGAQIEADAAGATASGGVTVTTATGAKAHAPRAVYNRKTGKITATGGVDFFDPARGLRQHGDTLVVDLGRKTVSLSNSRGQADMKLFEGKDLF